MDKTHKGLVKSMLRDRELRDVSELVSKDPRYAAFKDEYARLISGALAPILAPVFMRGLDEKSASKVRGQFQNIVHKFMNDKFLSPSEIVLTVNRLDANKILDDMCDDCPDLKSVDMHELRQVPAAPALGFYDCEPIMSEIDESPYELMSSLYGAMRMAFQTRDIFEKYKRSSLDTFREYVKYFLDSQKPEYKKLKLFSVAGSVTRAVIDAYDRNISAKADAVYSNKC